MSEPSKKLQIPAALTSIHNDGVNRNININQENVPENSIDPPAPFLDPPSQMASIINKPPRSPNKRSSSSKGYATSKKTKSLTSDKGTEEETSSTTTPRTVYFAKYSKNRFNQLAWIGENRPEEDTEETRSTPSSKAFKKVSSASDESRSYNLKNNFAQHCLQPPADDQFKTFWPSRKILESKETEIIIFKSPFAAVKINFKELGSDGIIFPEIAVPLPGGGECRDTELEIMGSFGGIVRLWCKKNLIFWNSLRDFPEWICSLRRYSSVLFAITAMRRT